MGEFEPDHGQFGTPQVVCPYCGYEPEEAYPEPNGDHEVEECNCGKKYYAYACVEYSSKRDCKLNGLECQWLPDGSRNLFADRKYDWFMCPHCLNNKIVKRGTTPDGGAE